MKSHFVIEDNVLDKSILKILRKQEFVKRRNIIKLQKDMIQVTANYFTNNDINKA